MSYAKIRPGRELIQKKNLRAHFFEHPEKWLACASRTTARCSSTIPVPVPWLFQFPNPPCLPTADGQRSKRALPRNRIEDLFHSLSVDDVSPSYSTQCSSK